MDKIGGGGLRLSANSRLPIVYLERESAVECSSFEVLLCVSVGKLSCCAICRALVESDTFATKRYFANSILLLWL